MTPHNFQTINQWHVNLQLTTEGIDKLLHFNFSSQAFILLYFDQTNGELRKYYLAHIEIEIAFEKNIEIGIVAGVVCVDDDRLQHPLQVILDAICHLTIILLILIITTQDSYWDHISVSKGTCRTERSPQKYSRNPSLNGILSILAPSGSPNLRHCWSVVSYRISAWSIWLCFIRTFFLLFALSLSDLSSLPNTVRLQD